MQLVSGVAWLRCTEDIYTEYMYASFSFIMVYWSQVKSWWNEFVIKFNLNTKSVFCYESFSNRCSWVGWNLIIDMFSTCSVVRQCIKQCRSASKKSKGRLLMPIITQQMKIIFLNFKMKMNLNVKGSVEESWYGFRGEPSRLSSSNQSNIGCLTHHHFYLPPLPRALASN